MKDLLETTRENKDTIDDEIHLKIMFPTLLFTVVDSKYLLPSTKIIITPSSLNKKTFNVGDRMIFGKHNPENAFNFPEHENVGNSQFEMRYDIEEKSYKIKDNRKGTGVFIRVGKMIIQHEYIFSFSTIHFFVYKPHKKDKLLKIKILHGNLKEKTFSFNPKEVTKVRIGRNKSNEIFCNDDDVSRIQCTFVFDQDWYVYDGTSEKASKNGLWMLATKEIPVENNMFIKTGNTTFRALIT